MYNFTDVTIPELSSNKDIFDKQIIEIPYELEEFLDDAAGGLKFTLYADSNELANTTHLLWYERRLSVY